MARGKKPAVTPYERQRWLDQLEGGKGITAIAKSAGRDIRIVKRHISLALEERQIAGVKRDFLLDRLRQHQEDILNEVERMKKIVPLYSSATLIPKDSMQKKIHEALMEHTRFGKLKGLIGTYLDSVQRYHQATFDAMHELHEREVELKKALPDRISTYDWTPSLLGHAKENLPMDEKPGTRYSHEKYSDGIYEIRWAAERLTSSPIPETDIEVVVNNHKILRDIAARYQSDFSGYRKLIYEAVEPLVEELDIMIMKRVVPGRCRYCPV